MKMLRLVASILLLFVAAPVPAAEFWNHAFPGSGSLTWSGFDTSGSTAVNVSRNGASSVSYSGWGGQFSGYFFDDGSASGDEFFRFFCVDLSQYATHGPINYSAAVLNNATLARLFDIAYPNRSAGDFFDGSSRSDFGLFATPVASSAFQLAVWEIFYETAGPYDLTSGHFKSKTKGDSKGSDAAKAVALADDWLDLINHGAGSDAGWTLYQFTNAGHQDYLAATYQPPVPLRLTSVPEPGTVALLSLAGGALAALRRRRVGHAR